MPLKMTRKAENEQVGAGTTCGSDGRMKVQVLGRHERTESRRGAGKVCNHHSGLVFLPAAGAIHDRKQLKLLEEIAFRLLDSRTEEENVDMLLFFVVVVSGRLLSCRLD